MIYSHTLRLNHVDLDTKL